jgi:hypothetical protein
LAVSQALVNADRWLTANDNIFCAARISSGAANSSCGDSCKSAALVKSLSLGLGCCGEGDLYRNE